MTLDQADKHIYRAWFAALLWAVALFCITLLAYSGLEPATRRPSAWWLHIPVLALLIFSASRGSAIALLLLLGELVWQHFDAIRAHQFFPTPTTLIVGLLLLQGIRAAWVRNRLLASDGGASVEQPKVTLSK